MTQVSYNGKVYDGRHGGPFDRGAADSYYGRGMRPHYYTGSTGQSQKVILEPGTPAYEEYIAGYEYNESIGSKKDWY